MIFVANNKEIPIKPLTKCEVIKTSPLTSLQQVGEYALSFETAITPELSKAFGFSDLLNIEKNVPEISAQVYDKSWLLFNGKAKGEYLPPSLASLSFSSPPGNIATELWNTKLTALDFGQDVIATSNLNTRFWRINHKDIIGTRPGVTTKYNLLQYGGQDRTTLKIYINNTEVYAKIFDWGSSNDRLNDVVDFYNEAPPSAFPNSYITLQDNEWVISESTATAVKIVIDVVVLGGADFSITYNLTRIAYSSIGAHFNASLSSDWTKPYHFPMVYAPEFYGSENPDFNGYINLVVDNAFVYNNDDDPTTYSFCPCFRVQWVFEKVCTLLGYTPNPAFWNTSVWKDVCLLTLVAIDKQLQGLVMPYNIYNNTIVYKDYMPDLTVQEFIDTLQNWLNITISFNALTQKVDLKSRNINLATAPKLNIDPYAQITKKTPTDTKKYQVKYKISTSDDASMAAEAFEVIAITDTNDVTSIEVAFAPMVRASEYQEVDTVNPQDVSPRAATGTTSNWNWSGSTTTTNPISTTPTGPLVCYEKGKSPMFDLSTEKPKARVLFYNIVSGVQVIDNTKDGNSLFIAGDNGLYKKQWETYFKMFEATTELQVTTNIPKLMLYQIDWATILILANVAWVASEIAIDPDSDISKLKLWRINPV